MLLNEYLWSGNPRGMHISSAFSSLNVWRYSGAHFGWIKLVVTDTRYVGDAATFLAAGITPIVRVWRPTFGAAPFNAELLGIYQAYINAGVKWFEFYNEPNQLVEWPEGTDVHWRNTDTLIRPMMDNWLLWAEYIISQGAYPGFIPLAETGFDALAAVRWLEAFMDYLAQAHNARFRNIIANGLFAATHPYVINHYYQEAPGQPATARPPEQQRAGEGGWHFEYPYDPISQASEPGITVASGPAWKPHGDPVGLIAMGQLFNEKLAQLFGTGVVPVVGTEGGIWPFPHPGQPSHQPDPRYPPITFESHGEATLAMFEWIATSAPAWFFGVCLWKEDEYYDLVRARAIDRLEQTPPLLKLVPASGAASPYAPVSPDDLPGPGPIHGEPDFHMVILAPGLEPRWFFETAKPYWNTFRPIVTSVTDFMDFFPYSKSLAMTIITPIDQVEAVRSTVTERFPHALLDIIIAEGDLRNVGDLLNARVWTNKRFGDRDPT